ncbi:MAG: FtsQ-type POTRA domain-containing protein [Clostridia bacterium]|nr:FtsQ-type POTRA domain-containing protein [Clostridia bacterium]
MEQVRFKRKTVDLDEMEKQQSRKRRRRNAFYVFLFLFILILFLGTAFFLFFRVKEISVTGNSVYSDEQIIQAAGIERDSNLFSFSGKRVEETVKSALPYVGSVTVKRDLPSGVVIEIEEKQAVMYTEINGDYYLLSDELYVLSVSNKLSSVPNSAIKLVTGSVDRCLVGQPITFMDARTRESVLEMYSVLQRNEMDYYIREIDITSRFDISMQYTDRFHIYIGDMDNFDLKIPFLEKVIDELYDEDKGSIDLSSHTEATVALE